MSIGIQKVIPCRNTLSHTRSLLGIRLDTITGKHYGARGFNVPARRVLVIDNAGGNRPSEIFVGTTCQVPPCPVTRELRKIAHGLLVRQGELRRNGEPGVRGESKSRLKNAGVHQTRRLNLAGFSLALPRAAQC